MEFKSFSARLINHIIQNLDACHRKIKFVKHMFVLLWKFCLLGKEEVMFMYHINAIANLMRFYVLHKKNSKVFFIFYMFILQLIFRFLFASTLKFWFEFCCYYYCFFCLETHPSGEDERQVLCSPGNFF